MKNLFRLALAAIALAVLTAVDFSGVGMVARGDLFRYRQYTTTGNLTLYVDTAGSDSNPCTQALPCLTAQAAVDKIPKLVRHPVTVQFGAGNFAMGAVVTGFEYDAKGDAGSGQVDGGGTPLNGAYILFQGTQIDFTPATGTASGTITASTTGNGNVFGTLTDSTQTWTVNNLRGQLVELLGATNETDRFRPIVSNTATVITIAGQFASGQTVGLGYRIRDWGTVFTGDLPPTSYSALTTSVLASSQTAAFIVESPLGLNAFTDSVTFRLMKFTGTGAVVSRAAVSIFDSNVSATSTTGAVQGNISLKFRQTVFRPPAGVSNYVRPIALGANTRVQMRFSYVLGAGAGQFISSTSPASDYSISDSQLENFATIIQMNAGTLLLQQSRMGTATSNCILVTSVNSAAVQAGNAIILVTATNALDLSSCTNAVNIGGPATFNVHGGTLSGTGNTTAYRLRSGANVQFTSSSTLTGTTEIDLDGATYTVAALRALSPKSISDATTQSRIWEN